MNDITYKTLEKFSKGKYSWNDYLKVKRWFSGVSNAKEMIPYLEEHWKEEHSQNPPDGKSLRHIYEQIEYHILLEENREARKRWLWHFYRQAAAILLIPVLAFALWHSFYGPKSADDADLAWLEINSPEGARTRFSLPDGSTGWLNSGSALKYHPGFKTRSVELTGEAWFDVVSDPSVFTVNAVDLDVHVYGTSFNVMAYPEESSTEVVLESGRVVVEGKNNAFERTLIPNQKLAFTPSALKFSVQEVDAGLYSAWKEGYLMLDNETLAHAVSRIERWYNVDIDIEDETLKSYRFKATFRDEPLEEVLRLLAITTPMEYEIEKRVAGADSLYRKKRVVLKR